MLANELADVDPHLLFQLEGLLQLLFLRTLIVIDGERCLQGFGAAVAGGNERVVLGVVLPEAAYPVEGQLVGERRLRAVAKSCPVLSSHAGGLPTHCFCPILFEPAFDASLDLQAIGFPSNSILAP